MITAMILQVLMLASLVSSFLLLWMGGRHRHHDQGCEICTMREETQ